MFALPESTLSPVLGRWPRRPWNIDEDKQEFPTGYPYPVRSKVCTFGGVSPLNLYLNFRIKFGGNQNLFEQDNSFQFRKSRAEGYVIPVQIKKDALWYHNVVKYVKLNLLVFLLVST